MSPATMTTVDAILKEIYGPRIEDQLQSEVTSLRRIERTSDGTGTTPNGGKYVDFPIRVRRNHGIGYRNEDEQLPASGQQGYAEVHVGLKYGYGRVRFTGQVMRLARTNAQAFANAVDREMNNIRDDLAKDSNRIVYGDSQGILTGINDTAVSATHVVDTVQYLEEGMIVDVLVESSGATVLLNTTIDVIVEATNTVTFGASFTGALTQAVYRQGSRNREPNGLGSIINATTILFGVNPASVRQWAGIVHANGGTPRALSEGLMIAICDAIRTKGSKPSVIFTNLGVRRAYFNLLTQQRRYTNTQEFTGGFQGLPFNYGGKEIPMVEDVDAPPGELDFVTEDSLKIYRDEAWNWADDDGGILKWVTNFDAWEGVMRQYWEIGTDRRNANGRLDDLIEG